MERLLITYGTRPLAQRLGRLLPAPERILFGACEAIPGVMLDTGKYVGIPHGASQAYAHEMLKCCLDHGADTLVPLGKAEIGPLAAGKQLFAEYGIRVLVPDLSVLEEMPVLENPASRTQVDILLDGASLLGERRNASTELSGVFAFETESAQPALCCLSD